MIIRSYAAAGLAIGSSAAVDDGITIGTTAQHTFTVPTAIPVGPVLPSWLTYAWEADSLALADGDPVASWTDSVSSLSLTEATIRPIYRANAGGFGMPGIEFGIDANQLITNGGLNSLTGSEFTVFHVMYLGPRARSDERVWGSDGTGGPQIFRMNLDVPGVLVGGVWRTVGSAQSRSALQLWTTSTNKTTRVDQYSGRTAGVGYAGASVGFGSGIYGIGRKYEGSYGYPAPGYVYGHYIANRYCSPSELTDMWDYLTSKWGTP